MKVKELISQLSGFDEELEIYIDDYNFSFERFDIELSLETKDSLMHACEDNDCNFTELGLDELPDKFVTVAL